MLSLDTVLVINEHELTVPGRAFCRVGGVIFHCYFQILNSYIKCIEKLG
jgi:hypothetical protein